MSSPLNRLNDFLFKKVFGSRENADILVAFLNAVLQPPPGQEITSITQENESLNPEYLADKNARLDVLAKAQDGRLLNIEVQLVNPYEMEQRTLYYWAALYHGQLKKGRRYRDLKPTITVNIIGYRAFTDDDRWHHVFELRERSSGQLLHGDLRIDFLEVPKVVRDPRPPDDPLACWMLYLSGVEAQNLVEATMTEPMIRKAMSCEEIFMKDERDRRHYLLREMALHDAASERYGALEEGFEKGREEGMQKGVQKGILQGQLRATQALARKLLARGMAPAEVADVTELDIAEVHALAH